MSKYSGPNISPFLDCVAVKKARFFSETSVNAYHSKWRTNQRTSLRFPKLISLCLMTKSISLNYTGAKMRTEELNGHCLENKKEKPCLNCVKLYQYQLCYPTQ